MERFVNPSAKYLYFILLYVSSKRQKIYWNKCLEVKKKIEKNYENSQNHFVLSDKLNNGSNIY